MSASGRNSGLLTKIKQSIQKRRNNQSDPFAAEMSEQEQLLQRKRRQVLADLEGRVNKDAREAEKVLPELRDELIKLINSEGSGTLKEKTVKKAYEPFADFTPLLTALRSDLREVYGANIPQADVQITEAIAKFVRNRGMKSIYTKLAKNYDKIDVQIQSLIDTGKLKRSSSAPRAFRAQSSPILSSNASLESIQDALPLNDDDVKGAVHNKSITFKNEANKEVDNVTEKVKKEAADIKEEAGGASHFEKKVGDILPKATSTSPSAINSPLTVDESTKQSLQVPSTSTRVDDSPAGSHKTLNPVQSDSQMILRAREAHHLPVVVLYHLETSLEQLILCTPSSHPDAPVLPKLMRDIEGLKTIFHSTRKKSSKGKFRVHADDWFKKQKKRILRRN